MTMVVTPGLIAQVRLLAFNPTEEQISDEQIGEIIQGWIDIIGDDDKNRCQILYNSLMSVLQWLWNRDIIDQGGESGGSTGRREKVGEVEVQTTYSSTSVHHSPWEDIYNRYLNGDLTIPGCGDMSGTRGIISKVIHGGVDACEIDRVNSDPRSVNGLGSVVRSFRRRHIK
ncbi:Uncharacterised protein [Serratia ficaria]|uniref:hypothetical protein n=1 Tax=Serratia ficaria TaxID=61651 RepID=UPI002182970C|nr:hypothetical protein [Serratia ficaria]CAI2504456.1 Uncharacterised protein [Serratia ficaria]